MRTSNIPSNDKIVALYDDLLLNHPTDPFLLQPNTESNTLWKQDYRNMLIFASGGVPPATNGKIITFKNGDGTTATLKLDDLNQRFFLLPLHARIQSIDNNAAFSNSSIMAFK